MVHVHSRFIFAVSSLACWHSALACQHSRAQHSLQCIFPGVPPSRYVYLDLDGGCFDWNRKKNIGETMNMRYHEILIHSTSKRRCFFQHLERICPFGGNEETPDVSFGKHKMHPDFKHKFAQYRLITDACSQKIKCTEVLYE